MAVSDHYQGREQSRIKHLILESYLKMLFMIIGQHKPRICYVDCFAGPWKEADENLSGTSVRLALTLMQDCRRDLFQRLGKNVQFRALFVERKQSSYQKLATFLSNNAWHGVETESIHGKFHELRTDILDWCGPQDFVFFFVDPTGWKNAIEVPTLRPLLERPRSEYLINFMYDFVNRAQPQTLFESDMQAIFGQTPDLAGLDPRRRETNLLKRYRKTLKDVYNEGTTTLRSASVGVLDPLKKRTKYHLVYLTRHPLGIVKFMETSEKSDKVQPKLRAQAKQAKDFEASGQRDFFKAGEDWQMPHDIADIATVKQYWLRRLTTTARTFGVEDLADMLEETKWFPGDFQRAFKELEKEGKVENVSAKKPSGRRTIFVRFHEDEKLRRT